MATTTSRPQVHETIAKVTEDTTPPGRLGAAMDAVSNAASTAGSLASDASTRLPGVLTTTRSAFHDANLQIQTSSDEMLRLGTAVSFGLAAGLLIAGANRTLVVAAMIPVGMLGMAMLERWSGSSGSTAASRGPGGL